ncbi:MAG: hypothetical protein ABIJ16_11175 [Bacteroidota bacterium]
MNYSNMFSNPGVIALIVILALLLFVFVPIMISRAGKQRKTAGQYVPNLIKMTGLQPSQDNAFRGEYKSFPTVLRMGAGYNYAEVGFEALKGLSGGSMNMYGRNMVYQKFTVEMDLPVIAPDFMMKEKVGILRTDQFIMDKISGKDVNLPEIKPAGQSLKRIRFFGNDPEMVNKLCADPELRRMTDNWHYTDVRITGSKLTFTLDDNMTNPTFGPKRTASPQFIVDGVDIAARVAQIVSA